MIPKYRNRKTVVDGVTFDSAKEARRWGELRLLERAGKIHGLRRQVSYALIVNEILIARYVADFVYTEGTLVVEDVKSAYTRKLPVYRIKNKLMRAIHSIDIREV